MNKFISLLLAFILTSLSANSQNPVTLAPGEYDILKSQGKLPLLFSSPKSNTEQETILNLDNLAPQAMSGGGSIQINCTGLIPVDSSFHIPHFVNQSDPQPISPLYKNDDGSAGPIQLPFDFCFYGQTFNSLYINNNGNVSFGQSYYQFSPIIFPNNQFSLICPFWADVNTSINGLVYYQMGTDSTYIVIRWLNVGYYNNGINTPSDKFNDFQLILTDGINPILPGGNNVAFSYGDMQWTTGTASGGTNGFGGSAAIVGANQGNGINSFVIGNFDHAGNDYDGPAGNNDGIDWLDNKTFLYNVCIVNSNLAPIPDGALAACDTIALCVGDTFNFGFTYLTTDAGETITTIIDTTDASGFQVISNTSGYTSVIDGSFVASLENMGLNIIDFTATDDGTPPASNTVTLLITVSEIVDPVISGDTIYCLPGNVELAIDSAFVYEDYTWLVADTVFASHPDSIINAEAGVYTVRAYNEFGCSRIDTILIQDRNNPLTIAVPNNILCYGSNNGSIDLNTNYPSPVQFTWIDENGDTLIVNNTTNGIDSLTSLSPGAYYFIATDTFGCIFKDTVTLTQPDTISISYSYVGETCEDNNASLQVTVSGATQPYQFNWIPAIGTGLSADSLSAGVYALTVTDNNNCVYTDSIVVPEIASPSASFTTSPPIVLANEDMTFTNTSTANGDSIVSWSWNFGDGQISADQNPTHAYADTGSHPVTLIIENSIGCTDTITQDIYITPEIVIPNFFTPNGDGQNDLFEITYLPALYPNSQLYVYNRWGNKVYHSDNYQNDWDGDKCHAGTYFFTLLLPNGDKKKGTITLIK